MTQAGGSGAARRERRLADRLARPLQHFAQIEAASSIVLLAAALVALVWANSPAAASYTDLWETPLSLSLGHWRLSLSLEQWVNDALMTIFFFVVGMEIKYELVAGELSSRARAMLPVAAALGGMIVPASIYALMHAGGPAAHGWGIPMATDIAFAVAALAILGPRVPPGLRAFLLALAIVDDLGAVTVIAVFYTSDLSLLALAVAAAGLSVTYALNRAGVRSFTIYWLVGCGTWLATLYSGVHATVAGVGLGFLTPTSTQEPYESLVARARRTAEGLLDLSEETKRREARHRVARELRSVGREALSPLDYLVDSLHPWVAFVIMPVFALANAGVHLEAQTLGQAMSERIAVAVALGLVLGKPIGITLASWLAVRARMAELPAGVSWSSLLATGLIAGIGFTMALFITALAFDHPGYAAASKVGILAGSTISAVGGTLLLSHVLPRKQAN